MCVADENGWTALMLAARDGDVSAVSKMLRRKADVEAFNSDKCTSLIIAAYKGHLDVMKLLLARKADIEAASKNRCTALWVAASNGHTEAASLLLDQGASIEAVNNDNHTPLLVAAKNGHFEVVRLLVNRKANIEASSKSLYTPLYVAAEKGHVTVARLLLFHKAEIDACASDHDTPLYIAAQNGHADMVRLLLNRNANIEASTRIHGTPLFAAACYGRVQVARLLLDRDANIEAHDKKRWTPLYIAAYNGHVDVVNLLLDRNAKMHVANKYGDTSICIASARGHVNIIRRLVKKGADVNSVDGKGDSALICAAKKGHVAAVNVLLENGANADAINLKGKRALDYAVEQDRNDIVQMIQTAALAQKNLPVSTKGLDVAMPPTEIIQTLRIQKNAPQNTSFSILDQVKLLCGTMHEAQAISWHIYSRLVRLSKQLSRIQSDEKEALHKTYAGILERYHAFLVQYGDKRIITRVVSGRVIVCVCRELRETLNGFDKLCGGIHRADDDGLKWNNLEKSFFEIQRGLMKSMLAQNHLWKNELQSHEAQAEALAFMLFELNYRADEYGSDELDLIRQIFWRVSSYSTLGIPPVPMWFLPPHEVVLGNEIDRGSYGSVHSGTWLSTSVAVKSVIFQTGIENRYLFLKEADLWSSLQHPHIIKLYGACHVGNPFFVCELASNGNLSDFLYRSQSHHKAWKYLHETALGLWYLHSKQKIVHRDIKGNNILICKDDVAKLTDFGLSCHENDLSLHIDANMVVGALHWKAPEVIAGASSGSFASDVYSFGMTIIEVMTQRPPWGMMPDIAVKHKVAKLNELPKQPTVLNDFQWKLVKQMCSPNPNDRIDMGTVVQVLEEFAAQELDNHLQADWKACVHGLAAYC